ncbi:MAG: hypothetical protein HWD61_13570 [Parachlamydiaceae bacterium]|nr:MAG: hypothetical protein HWD61_13570 [Parachlamydiaceae bacterium]
MKTLDFSKFKFDTDADRRSMVHGIFNQIYGMSGTDAENKIPSLSTDNIYFLAPNFHNAF